MRTKPKVGVKIRLIQRFQELCGSVNHLRLEDYSQVGVVPRWAELMNNNMAVIINLG